MATKDELRKALSVISKDLDRTMEFWLKHSHDETFGGFFTCLGKDGTLYDDLKYGWLQGRQVWTYARLYNTVERFHRTEIIEAAIKGAEFLLTHGRDPHSKKCYFVSQRDGRPIKVQRTIFSECFYIMAMAEMAKACRSHAADHHKYKEAALEVMDLVRGWVLEDDSGLGRRHLSGETPTNVLAVPMMLLCLADQLENSIADLDETHRNSYDSLTRWSIERILAHSQRGGTAVLENVSETGEELPGSAGRLQCPGHAIECGWFLLTWARRWADPALEKVAIETFMEAPFTSGWDAPHGGLFYFLDVEGFSPTQLEWDQKLWWVHNEAMISFLMAYQTTGKRQHWDKFTTVMEYCYKHFLDEIHGEWYGYLHRDGSINLDFKGGPFKGCFHVPRCLMMCELMLTSLLQKQ